MATRLSASNTQWKHRTSSSTRSGARAATLLAAASGFYMVDRLGLWANFLLATYWWLDAMVLVWLLFTLLLFVAEPLFLER